MSAFTQKAAVALSKALDGRAEGGAIGSILGTPVGVAAPSNFAEGGGVGGQPHSLLTKGSILSEVPGRTDSHATHVPSGSYVIPADIVSGRGEGNTLAGSKALERLFKLGGKSRRGLPRLSRLRPSVGLAAGGAPEAPEGSDTPPVRVNLAGGEIVVPPENLMDTVHPDLKIAHEIMDAWVLNERKNLRKELARLPGPVKE